MCDTIGDLRQALSRYAAGFDGAVLTVAQATRVVTEAVVIERIAGHLKMLAAARTAEAGAWKAAGHRSPAHYLAHVSGSSVGQAADALETARRLEKLPDVAAAARSGALSGAQASAVADAAVADPGAEQRLIDKAQGSSLSELRDECARTKAIAAPDLEARRRSIHTRRFLRNWTDLEGAWHVHMRHNPEVGAEVMAALTPIRDHLFAAARAAGRRESSAAYAADAMVELATGGCETDIPAGEKDTPDGETDTLADDATSPTRAARTPARRAEAKIIARIDLPALLRGRPVEGEVCELAGFGPVAVSAVRDLIDSRDPFLAAVVTRGDAVVGVAHLGRRPNAAQQTALQWLYPTCAAEGCATTTGLQFDHRIDWADTHFTLFDLVDRLCCHHHDRKTREGWGLVAGRGKRAFVPPTDPRHPRRSTTDRASPPSGATSGSGPTMGGSAVTDRHASPGGGRPTGASRCDQRECR